MLSKRSKYGIKAVLYIARQKAEHPVLASEIAERERIPHKFLEAILRDLVAAGILKSRRGRSGGYFLRKPKEQITFAEIMRVFDGPIALIPCVSENFYEACPECADEKTCVIRKVFLRIRVATLDILEESNVLKLLDE